ncbi:MAG TPA: peptidylprolyl isomerase [Myxococcota bacterium]|nr:peptidylprolyl isomerase [Myxococcota bacterium]
MKRLGISLVVLLATAAIPPVAARILDRIAAVVNDDVILLSEVDSRCRAALDEIPSNLPLAKMVERKRQVRKQTLDELVEELLFKQQVHEHKIVVSDEEVDQQIEQLKKTNNMTEKQFSDALRMEGRTIADLRSSLHGQLERQKMVDAQMRNNPDMRARVQVGEKDIDDYYRKHFRSTASKEKVRASHILFVVPPKTGKDAEKVIHDKAQEVLAKIRKGAEFAKMAKEFSDDPSGSAGGDLGWFHRGDMMAAFEKSAFGLKKGQISDLVQTKLGYHIILVTDRAVEGPPPLEKVVNEIRSNLYREKFREAMKDWLTQLRRNSFVEYKL